MIKILDLQARASIQDLGRFGWREYGIGHCGAMDTLSLQAGNLLLANPTNSPAIEVILGGIQLYFEQDTPFCLTGAFYEAYLDDNPIYAYWRYNAKAGQILRLVRAKIGMYGYICIQGGIAVPKELGSCSTDLKTQLGGLHGRLLQTGDKLPTACQISSMSSIGIAPPDLSNTIYAIPSSEYSAFLRKSQYHFWQNRWTLQSNSDRMGYRLKGEPLQLKKPLEMLSHPIQMGIIQVPPDGQPIVLMADAQTTGGYPKIACVIQADLGRLAQLRLGSEVQFASATPEIARKRYQANQIYLNHIRRIINENP